MSGPGVYAGGNSSFRVSSTDEAELVLLLVSLGGVGVLGPVVVVVFAVLGSADVLALLEVVVTGALDAALTLFEVGAEFEPFEVSAFVFGERGDEVEES